MIKLDKNFPIYLIKNFFVLDEDTRKILIEMLLENKLKNHKEPFASFPISVDFNDFFANLYKKFFLVSSSVFGGFSLSHENTNLCWSYCSNKYDHGFDSIHNHINTSTINSVYYLNIPPRMTLEKGSITFFLEDKTFTYKPNNHDLLIFPNYLNHRVNNYEDDEEYRVSINMEIKCIETSEELFQRIKH